ncbi:MAG: prolyl aminopeptidase [Rhodospirillales bacterium]|nr:prolyl aminopeptidase [Rhodospirillales bacterium]MCB9995526.1 prolyl aminopeptidase [Rhodospirillales bacterium]
MYPLNDPYDFGFLDVGHGHSLYYELCGNPDGEPALFLHGGPGAGMTREALRLFDPQRYRLVMFDQRGAGKSRFEDCLAENSPAALVKDIETLRAHLGIDRWLVFGGSWGTALALFYAGAHAEHIRALVMAGIFTATREELDWQAEASGAAAFLMPEWYVPVAEFFTDDLAGATVWHKMQGLFERDPDGLGRQAAQIYMRWNRAISRHDIPYAVLDQLKDSEEVDFRCMRIVAHFYTHHYRPENQQEMFRTAQGLAGVPCHIIHGRYDMICPMQTAWALHQVYPGSALHVVQDGGHSGLDASIAAQIIDVLNSIESEG